MRLLICGDRNWEDEDLILTAMENGAPDGSTIIEGGARGADRYAARTAAVLGLACEEFPAEWTKQGRAAGPIRNKRMLDEKPDEVWAFHDHIALSRGTKDMIRQALKAGVKVVLFSHAQPYGEEVMSLEAIGLG